MAGGAKAKKLESQTWSDLPPDTINLIANRLSSYVDQIRFLAVCKSWRAADIIEYADYHKLPWLMVITAYVCYLFDPSQKQVYTVFNSTTAREKFAGLRMLDSKREWMLFSTMFIKSSSPVSFYTPFTDKIVELPDLDNYVISNATFSTGPNSPDCVACAVVVGSEKFCINIWRPGGITWKEFWLEGKYEWCDNVEYVNGFFYCSFDTPDAMGAFNVASGTWISIPYPQCLTPVCLIESDGNLLMSHVRYGGYSVLTFNQAQMDWLETESLDDRALFCCDTCISVPVGKGSQLANTIHVFDWHSYSDHSNFLWENPESYSPEPGPKIFDYHDCEVKKLGKKVWIQPPLRGT